jgi:hypothetical protein
MLAFAVIGWAWLAVRELMGDTPVADVSILLSLLISSVINLLLALVYTSDQFKSSAQAFLNHTACVCFLYVYSLSQSTTDGRGLICCALDGVQSSVYSLRLTYRAAYFGGLVLHQPAAAITVSFLTFFLILSAAQARACMPEAPENRGELLMGKSALGLICLLCLQQAMFSLKAPVCRDKDIPAAVISMVCLALLSMLDMPWIFRKICDPEAVTDSGVKKVLLVGIVQLSFEMLSTLLIGVMTAVLTVNLGSGDALLLIVGFALCWQGGQWVSIALDIRNGNPPQDKQTTLGTHFNNNTSHHMLLPGVRELRRNRDKKAW